MTKHAVVLGAGSGMGAALARCFGREGYCVSLVARSASPLDRMVQGLEREGVQSAGFTGDLGDLGGIPALIDRTRDKFGTVDTLIFNASAFHPGIGTNLPAEDLARDFAISVAAAQAATLEVHEDVVAATGGLLYTGSGAALTPMPDYFTLSITKAALRALALSWHAALAGFGVAVGTVTIQGNIAKGTAFDPDRIAEEFWRIRCGQAGPEVLCNGH